MATIRQFRSVLVDLRDKYSKIPSGSTRDFIEAFGDSVRLEARIRNFNDSRSTPAGERLENNASRFRSEIFRNIDFPSGSDTQTPPSMSNPSMRNLSESVRNKDDIVNVDDGRRPSDLSALYRDP